MKAFNFRSYLERHFDLKESGDFVYFKCIFCGGQWKMWAKVGDSRPWCWCFKCEQWADVLRFVMRHQGIERWKAKELIQQASERMGLDSVGRKPQREHVKAKTVLPAEYEPIRPLARRGDFFEKMAYEYLKRRGVTDSQIVKHRIGFCSTGKKYHGCIVLPVTKDREIVYFTCRTFCRPGAPRYLNPLKEEIGIGKAEVIFNFDEAKRYDEIVICEGYFDGLAVGDHGTAILGKKLSKEQVAMIVGSDVKVAGVCFDDDAKRETAEAVELLCSYGIQAFPMSPLGKDPSDAGGKLNKRKRSFRDLIALKIGER